MSDRPKSALSESSSLPTEIGGGVAAGSLAAGGIVGAGIHVLAEGLGEPMRGLLNLLSPSIAAALSLALAVIATKLRRRFRLLSWRRERNQHLRWIGEALDAAKKVMPNITDARTQAYVQTRIAWLEYQRAVLLTALPSQTLSISEIELPAELS
jgi:hypothetical protein